MEETKFKSADGTEVHGFLVHPPNETVGRKHPHSLRPHGGPQSQYANEFDFEKQLFAANGYAVVMPNPRGSTGRGTDYAMGIYASWGGVDVQDDLAAVDDAVARGIADPDRLVVGGWSYGGMSTNYLIATHDPLQSGGAVARRFPTSSPAMAPTNTFATTSTSSGRPGRIRTPGKRFPILSCTPTGSKRRPFFSVGKAISTFRCSTASKCIRPCER